MSLANWRDVAVVLLALEAFAGVLAFGVITYFAVRGVLWVKGRVPLATVPARRVAEQVASKTDQAGRAVATPFVWLEANAVRLQVMVTGVAKTLERSIRG